MANFEVLVETVGEVSNHPNADRLSLVQIRGFTCISAKLEDGSHRYTRGDLVVYIPEGALVPNNLLRMGFWDEKRDQGILAGSKGNRVKAIKLRDITSQGIIFPLETRRDANSVIHYYVETSDGVKDIHANYDTTPLVGKDVADALGITKYEPPIPASMSGEVDSATEYADNFDIENIKKYNEIFKDGEEVVVTEKLHGTNCRFIISKDFIGVTSKGLGKQGLIFKNNEKNSVSNVYVKMLDIMKSNLQEMQNTYFDGPSISLDKIYIYGEIYGKGIQDLYYDAEVTPRFRLFDIKLIWESGDSYYMNSVEVIAMAEKYHLDMVPILYKGPFSEKVIETCTSGPSMLGSNIREGCVIRPINETDDRWIGRKFLKSVSEDYLTRKGSTTEYQ